MHTARPRHLIGYWISSFKDEEFCAPQEVVGYLPPEVRSGLSDYLDAGSRCGVGFGYSWCRFFCDIPSEKMGSGERTDGCWIWPDGLSHYVRAHGIILPEEFTAHALAQKPHHRPSTDSDEEFFGAPSSLDYWRDWCAARRSSSFLERLRRARAEADKIAAEAWAYRIRQAQQAAQHKLSDRRCIWAGCAEKAITGMRICARHTLNHTDYTNTTMGFYAVTRQLVAYPALSRLSNPADRVKAPVA